LVERTEGNPFYLEESVRTLAETGALAGERGTYRLTRPVEQLKIPATVQAILAARIDRLAPEGKRLLQAAAVIGKDLALPLLLTVADAPEEDVRAELTRLQAAELLYEVKRSPDLEYTFKHALTHEVACGGLLQERRRTLNARIVDAIEAIHRDRLEEHVERLAHHALQAELREKAVHYLRRAGLKAASRSTLKEARECFEQALGIVETLPESHSILDQALGIRLELPPVLTQLAEVPQALERLREAESIAKRLKDVRRLQIVYTAMASRQSVLGELDEALVTGSRALELAERLGDLRLRIITTRTLEQTHYYRGEYESRRAGEREPSGTAC
jgi:predicted ATPase